MSKLNSLAVRFMKTKLYLLQTRIFCAVALGMGSSFDLAAATENSADTAPATTAIPWSQLGAKAGADYQGDALAVIPTAEGARLRCAFQRLEGEATREGLWLTSTVIPPGATVKDRFRLVAVVVGRGTPRAPGAANKTSNIQHSTSNWKTRARCPLTARACASPGRDWWRNTPRAWTACGRILWCWSVRPAWASWSCGWP